VKVVIKVSRRSNRVEVVQKRSVLKSPKEKNARRWYAKEVSRRSKSSRKGKVLAEGRTKKFAEGLEERRKFGVALVGSSRGDRGAGGT